jgi:hypothetical protein
MFIQRKLFIVRTWMSHYNAAEGVPSLGAKTTQEVPSLAGRTIPQAPSATTPTP